MKSNINFD